MITCDVTAKDSSMALTVDAPSSTAAEGGEEDENKPPPPPEDQANAMEVPEPPEKSEFSCCLFSFSARDACLKTNEMGL